MEKLSVHITNVIFVPPASRLVFGFLFYYNVIKPGNVTEHKVIGIYASDILSMKWGLAFYGEGAANTQKILFAFAKEIITEKLKEGTLNDQEELILLTSSQPEKCPYRPEDLPGSYTFEVETGKKFLIEELQGNKLAASIIETRDFINAIFSLKNNEKLLLLNQERNLLDFFKQAYTEEDFSHRISSLGQVSRHLNVNILRKLTNEPDTTIGSVKLLENFLRSINRPNKKITEILKNIGRIRQRYPVHVDAKQVVEAHTYFGITYPIRDFENAWITVLHFYYESLKDLKEALTDAYLS